MNVTPPNSLTRAAGIAFFLAMLTHSASPQSTVVGKGCDLAALGAKDTRQFLAFDHDLRNAIQNQDAGKISLLAAFPLRVNDEKGSYYIHDPASLQGRLQLIFTPEIRQTILASTRESIWCNYTGIDYGSGDVWANRFDRGYFLATINLHTAAKPKPPTDRQLAMACSTGKHRIIVDTASDGTSRYRSWNADHSLAEKPDLEISKGKEESRGTGPCYQRSWNFKNDQTRYKIEEASGCYAESDAPPKDAKAQLTISIPEKSDPLLAWCF